MKFHHAAAFLFLASFCHCAVSCPALCKCYSERMEVVCSEVPLIEFPTEGLPENTTMLTLHLYGNKLQSLSSHLLRGVPQLHTLDLTENKLSDLPNLFQGLTSLTHLSLDFNQLSHIPIGWFDPLSSLEESGLDLSLNPLRCNSRIEYLWRWLQKNKKKVLSVDNIISLGSQLKIFINNKKKVFKNNNFGETKLYMVKVNINVVPETTLCIYVYVFKGRSVTGKQSKVLVNRLCLFY
uniref:LRRCT domain-containing protein n=1 Tax=Cyprinodon variegatus TaxID=28743 RepID=A0A3Q2G916_CYPVA